MSHRSIFLLAWAIAGATYAGQQTHVLIVGNNESVDPSTAPLRHADDDAARYYELFEPLASSTRLLTVMDAETQQTHRGLASSAQAPTKENLYAAVAQLNVQMEEDRARGDTPVLVLVYVGHGHVGGTGHGYVSFLDGPLTGDELLSNVVAKSRASYNHLIFDACNSFMLIAGRGGEEEGGPDLGDTLRAYLDSKSLSRYPNTGFLFSTSRAKETYEWSVFRGGVFSHEVRSALAGAADVNSDGRIEYSELEAFLAAANVGVQDPRARLEAFVRPPALDRNRPLVDLAESRFMHYLEIPASFSGRFYLEDARGVRYADANKTTEAPVFIALVPSHHYYLRTDEGEARISLKRPGTVKLASVALDSLGARARGSIAESFQQSLFSVPYGPGFYHGFVSQAGATPAVRLSRPFPPTALQPRAASQPLKNPYAR